jgi:hypothetical protein
MSRGAGSAASPGLAYNGPRTAAGQLPLCAGSFAPVAMRSLYVVPILHTAADLGSLADSVRAYYLARYGPAAYARREEAVLAIWADVRQRIDAMGLEYSNVRIYQDGLPVCGQEMKIVEELAAAGSANHQLVLDLVHRGASLVGTEEPGLLIREYQMHRRQLDPASGGVAAGSPPTDEAGRLLEARDRFIARQITESLGPDQTGILFLGAAHRIDSHLAPDIQVRALD